MAIFGWGDGGSDRHLECRDCGANLSEDVDSCPECGGAVAEYEF